MTVDVNKLGEFTGKQVILTVKDGDGASQLEGKVEAASAQGMAFKEKGKRDVVLIMPGDIIEVAAAPDKPKSIAQKKLKLVTESTARAHLLDRHGYGRKAVNAMSDEDAFKQHEQIDHDDLGHKHVAAEEKAEAEAGSEG